MSAVVFQQNDLDQLTQHYPLSPARFSHALQNHPLLSLDALANAALQLRPQDVERRVSEGHVGRDFAIIERHALPIDQHIRAIETDNAWIMLARIEQLPAYRALIVEILAQTGSTLKDRTGSIDEPVGFIFISARGSTTPFHFDPEYNLFFQISGHKSFTTFPPAPPLITDRVNEEYHYAGNNMLHWQDDFERLGTRHALKPGCALFVPYKAPHYVEVGDALSLSLSITWKSLWAQQQEHGHRFNARMRKWGLSPRSLSPWPASAAAKAMGARVLGKAGLMA